MTKKRTKPVVKEIFTDKPAAEVWNDGAFKEYVAYVEKCYKEGDDFYRNFQWTELNNMIDDVLAGKIYVEKPLDIVE